MNRHARRAIGQARKRIAALREEALKEARGIGDFPAVAPAAHAVLMGWSICISADLRTTKGTPWDEATAAPLVPEALRPVIRVAYDLLQAGKTVWMFSAVLHPLGRSSTEAEWSVLGQLSAAAGAPADPVTPIATTDPNAALYWVWVEESQPGDRPS